MFVDVRKVDVRKVVRKVDVRKVAKMFTKDTILNDSIVHNFVCKF